ncbi:S1C family serine protease [Nocardioides insulae]|uniref:S1C family serine protease n=1 Tax=Nocardioides insulae TaxID=394734 RepID=UPI00042734DD|nr:trypsin-like peptidase domain-containing protein [Nocardioides insulae]
MAALALVLGVAGGYVGATLQDESSPVVTTSGRTGDVGNSEPAPVDAAEASVVSVADALLPSTVQIIAGSQSDGSGATGSGFVLNDRGQIITNNHVVAGVSDGGRISVIDHKGNEHDAVVLGTSPVYDIAVLSVPSAKDLAPAALGSADALKVGEPVVAIGSPLGLSSTVTSGIVSALQRPVTTGDTSDDLSYINAIQTDAAINPGNSGGPLTNMLGQVVGVNTAIATAGGMGDSGNIGVGFAIPVEQVKVTAQQIIDNGEARYPVIGAQVDTRPATEGARVQSVNNGSPAADAGLQAGDVVVEVAGQRVTDGIALIVAIRTHQPGETIRLTVEREGQTEKVDVTLDGQVG